MVYPECKSKTPKPSDDLKQDRAESKSRQPRCPGIKELESSQVKQRNKSNATGDFFKIVQRNQAGRPKKSTNFQQLAWIKNLESLDLI